MKRLCSGVWFVAALAGQTAFSSPSAADKLDECLDYHSHAMDDLSTVNNLTFLLKSTTDTNARIRRVAERSKAYQSYKFFRDRYAQEGCHDVKGGPPRRFPEPDPFR